MRSSSFRSPSSPVVIVVASASAITLFAFASSRRRLYQRQQRHISNSKDSKNTVSLSLVEKEEIIKEKNIELFHQETERNLKILSDPEFQILLHRPWGFPNCHFASLLAQIRPSPFWGNWGKLAKRRTEHIATPGGGAIEVEYVEPINLPYPPPSNIPIIIILHGITGNSREPYTEQAALHIAVEKRWRAVILNYGKVRVSNDENRPCIHGGHNLMDGGDLNFLISHIRKYHNGFLAAIGYSMGGAKLVQYLSRTREHSNLDAACIVSSPLDFTEKNVTVHRPHGLIHRFYHFLLAQALKVWIIQNYDELKKHPKVSSTKPFRKTTSGLLWWIQASRVTDVDEALTIHAKGYKDLNHYYNDATSADRLKEHITIPFLCITAKNDPFVPAEIIPSKEVAMANDNVFIVNTKLLGGHIGFWLPGRGCWATKGCLSFFDSVKKHVAIKPKSKYFFRQSSLHAAHNLQRTSSTGLNNYYKFLPDYSSSCLKDLIMTDIVVPEGMMSTVNTSPTKTYNMFPGNAAATRRRSYVHHSSSGSFGSIGMAVE
uniref:AB hydrolase-1 domain-containing protein n=1 Tax=Ditylum brightwellii TaxID=49249 RepID=A0A7S4T5N9_9STRA